MGKRAIRCGLPDEQIRATKFGRLKPLELVAVKTRGWCWVCECDCGQNPVVKETLLAAGKVVSCGCFRREKAAERLTTHGLTAKNGHRKMYFLWHGMVERCTNPDRNGYEEYGGRGITVCDRWLGIDGLKNFITDMGPRPSPRHSIDRRDNSKGYSPENCRWATNAEQARNKRVNKFYTFAGTTMCLEDWARKIGTDPSNLRRRIKLWGIDRALTQPIMKMGRRKL